MNQTHHAHSANGRHKKGATTLLDFDLASIDVEQTIRKHPLPSIAIAGAVGATIGLTLGSGIMRMIIGSVGMYTLTDVVKRYAKRTLDEMNQRAK